MMYWVIDSIPPHSKIQNPKSHKGEMRNADIEKPYMPN